MKDNIVIEGIETNNLKNIDAEIIKSGINLILGPSGSGKSTLAYETISQIGQHEYMSMFADDIQEPTYKVRSVKNMLPAVPIKQTNHNNNPRSSIGTYFGITHKLVMIYAALLNLDEEYFLLSKEENTCEHCHGLGTISIPDPNKIVDYNSTIRDIPFRCWNRYKAFFSEILCEYCSDIGIDPDKRFRDLSIQQQDKLLCGESSRKYTVKYKKVGRTASRTTKYYGVMLERALIPGGVISKNYYSDSECPECHGMKYNKEHLQYKISGLSIGEFLITDFSQLISVVDNLISIVSEPQLRFILIKLAGFIKKSVELQLGHLYLNRSIPTLSGGELQRLRLVQVFNTQLSNLLVVLDEPLAGLSMDEKTIIKENVNKLSNTNTILIVDHGKEFLDVAKQVICLGPVGGTGGGYIVDTNTYISNQREAIDFQAPSCNELLQVSTKNKVYRYNGCDVEIALERMNLLTGSSGIGKTTLLREYFPQVLDNYTYVNQKPLIGNTNSCVATAINVSAKISAAFGAKFNKDRKFFSNLTGNAGCCPKCGGAGFLEFGGKTGALLLVECRECHGTGFNAVLKKFRLIDKNIFEIWNMTIDEAADYFQAIDKKIYNILAEAQSIRLGYLKLGQPTKTLSGGENIRVKLLKSVHSTAKIIGIDEPFKGLNNMERKAVGLFLDDLRSRGKTIVVIDHTEGIDDFFSKRIVVRKANGMIVGEDRQ